MMQPRTRARLRGLLLVLIALLYVASIPWYREAGSSSEIWWGLPDWVTWAVLCYLAAAVCNAAAWLLTDMPEEGDGEPR